MRHFQQFAKCVVLVLLGIFLIIASQAISDLDAAFNELRPKILLTVNDTDEAAQKGIEAFGALESTANNQATYWKDLPRITKKTVDDFHDLVIHTDVQLNGTQNDRAQGLIPQATYDLRTANTSLARFDEVVATFPPLMEKISGTAGNIEDITADPRIKDFFRVSLDTSVQFDGMATDGHKASSLALGELQAYLKPARKAIKIYRFIEGKVVPAAQVCYYLCK